MDFLAQIVVWLNAVANACGRVLLAPVAWMPGWLSATIIAAVTGVVFLVLFKYTSPQKSIKKVRDDIKANLFALKLFKDNPSVVMRAQGRLFVGAFWLLIFAIVPMIVMMVPVLLILGQMALWYQTAPLPVEKSNLITVHLKDKDSTKPPEAILEPSSIFKKIDGPFRFPGLVCWRVEPKETGYQHLVFHVNGQTFDKELAVGDGLMLVSAQRPNWDWWEALLNPWETPFRPDSAVQKIEIDYPQRPGFITGTDNWVIYWFIVSMVAALMFRKALKVNI